MQPEEVREFVFACDYRAKKETMKVLAGLSEKSNFNKATETVRDTISHGASGRRP
jgi:hypothetical protein